MSGDGREPLAPRRHVVGIALGTKDSVAGWQIAVPLVVAGVLCLMFVSAFMNASPSAAGGAVCTVSGTDMPPEYVPLIQEAVIKYKLGPRGFSIVAGIHKVESDFARSPLPGVRSGTNSSKAAGPGQFLLETWETWGTDGDGDGVRDIYSIPDSVFATARYLRASGAPGDWYAAIFAYNHADWYVEKVLETAKDYVGEEACKTVAGGPLGELPADALGRVVQVAKWMEGQHIHYCWGGGHDSKVGPSHGEYCWNASGEKVYGAPEKGLDCSGAVRWLLTLAGFRDTGPIVSGDFAAAYPSGPGQHVTIWSNAAHVFIEVDGRDWGTASANFAHGPAFGSQSSAGFVASHPPGL